MKNTLREASYYQLAFKNNLTLTELEGKVGLLGLNKDLENFYKGIEEKEEDYYWKNEASHSEDYDGLDRHLGNVMNQVEEETICEDYPVGGMIEPYDLAGDR